GYPGVPSLDILGNVIPYIGGDEEGKFARETVKILGSLSPDGERIEPLPAQVAANCHRVPVIDGHMVTASVGFQALPPLPDLAQALDAFAGRPQERNLPSAPARPIHRTEALDRPQPRRDAAAERGMATTVGRLRPCPILGVRFTALSHNVIRGAAGAALLNAELIRSENLL
ncbi:MAG TPA: Asd/ArgC dimerization domain-containing protein, partial [Thermoanaerobaculia bacterium]|nr:Asd/ArgC dimerization domain-containing protein [Thermoanaerobaculia bacterium]